MKRTCSIEGCDLPHKGHGLCVKHWQRMRKNGTTELRYVRRQGKCSVEGCDNPDLTRHMCGTHYRLHRIATGMAGVCTVPDCGRPRFSATLCSAHHRQQRDPRVGLRRGHGMEWKYGLTMSKYHELLDSQGGVCAIEGCGESVADSSGKPLQVDHDHLCCPGVRSCGKCIRGLLCRRHNRIAGYLEHTDRAAVDKYITESRIRNGIDGVAS